MEYPMGHDVPIYISEGVTGWNFTFYDDVIKWKFPR